MATRRRSTGADRTLAPAPTRPPERHRRATNAAVVVVATLPFWQTPDDVLNPLFSAALSRALWPPVVAQALALLLFAAWRTGRPAPVSWRVCWSTLALWKVLSEPLLETLAEPLLALGPSYGVFAGRVLLGMVPTLALWTWLVDSLSCKERAHYMPAWFLPLIYACSLAKPFVLPGLTFMPECHILQAQGVLLWAVALLSPSAVHRLVPRNVHPRYSASHHAPRPSFPMRVVLFAGLVLLAHGAAQFSHHCPTSPPYPPSSGILASRKSTTGWISVGEYRFSTQGADGPALPMRYLRADHSLLGGLWVGESRDTLARTEGTHHPLDEKEVVRRAETIYSTFVLQELVRLVRRPEDLPGHEPERALIIGVGAGLSARALALHGVNLTLIEIDPVVYNFATRYFGVDDVRAGEVVLEDAVAWVDRQEARGQFDYIVHDVFTGGAVPARLFCLQFLTRLDQLLHPSGVLALNFAGDLSSLSSLMILTTLHRVFPRCRAFSEPATSTASASAHRNFVLLCTKDWLTELELRDPVRADYLSYPAPRTRDWVFSTFRQQEVDLGPFKRKANSPDGDKWVLADEKAVRRAEREQVEGVGQHWRVMQGILPSSVWARW